MSEDKGDNITHLRPGMTVEKPLADEVRNQILVESRDEMIEMLDGIRGRVMAFDIRGLAMVGFASDPAQDITFLSRQTGLDVARTVGSLEFVKHAVIDNRLRQIDEYDDE